MILVDLVLVRIIKDFLNILTDVGEHKDDILHAPVVVDNYVVQMH